MSNKALVGLIILILIILGGITMLFVKQRTNSPFSPSTNQSADLTPTIQSLHEFSVRLNNTGFTPKTITIKVNEGIRWENKSSQKATIHSADHPTHKKFPELNLGEFKPGTSLLHIFTKEGTYQYHNHYNSAESGTVIVQH